MGAPVKPDKLLDLRKFCVQIATGIVVKAIMHPTANDVVNAAKKLEEYITPETVEVEVTPDVEQ